MRRFADMRAGIEHRVERVAQSCERLVINGVQQGVVLAARLREWTEGASGGTVVVVQGVLWQSLPNVFEVRRLYRFVRRKSFHIIPPAI